MTGLDDRLAWGLFVRGLGAVYFVAFLPLHREILALAGGRGVSPVAQQLERMRRDLPRWQRWLHFPSLLWVASSDRALRALVWCGSLASLAVTLGGAWSPAALLACWALYLSLDVALDLFYPWDCLLLEGGFLALFVPALSALPTVGTVEAPAASIAVAYRLLLFRVVFGFGKFKFFGPGPLDTGYLKGFLLSQPLPTRLGYRLARLPMWAMKLGLLGLFVVEIGAPFALFAPAPARWWAATAIIALMVSIQAAGNFGSFNLLTALLCILPWARGAPLLPTPLAFGTPRDALESSVLLLVATLGLVQLPFNNWVTRSWTHWGVWQRAPWSVRALLSIVRVASAWRLVHGYGVFGRRSGPPAKWVPVVEGTADGVNWLPYRYRHAPDDVERAPTRVAPFTPRLDHLIVYEASGLGLSNYFAGLLHVGNPYRFSAHSFFERMVERLLEPGSPVAQLFAHVPFSAEAPPAAIRVRLALLRPTSVEEQRRTGRWWTRRFVATHLGPTISRPHLWREWLPEPELFQPDQAYWRCSLATLCPAAPTTCLEGLDGHGVEPMDVRDFWRDFVPAVRGDGQLRWETLGPTVTSLRERYAPDALHRFERVWARARLLLLERLDAQLAACGRSGLAAPSRFHLALAADAILVQGQGAAAAALGSLEPWWRTLERLDPVAALFPQAAMRSETLTAHARKARLAQLLLRDGVTRPPSFLPGFLQVYPLLAGQVVDPDEDIPTFGRTPAGDWYVLGEERAG